MRGITVTAALVLALGACAENSGWNPNYSLGDRPYGGAFDRDTPYTRYLTHREAALQGETEPSRVIPIARPFKAPTAEDIAGPNLWQIIQGNARSVAGVTEERPDAIVATGPVQTATVVQGPYPGSTPVLVSYARTATHTPGTRIWARPDANASRAMQACRSYASVDAAQIGFLAHGGPNADPLGLDPDGDGFVCGWNPAPWRQAAR